MMMNRYIKTKAFGQLTGVSVRTLQYYDEIDLLKPAYINEYGHRFYDSDSFSKMFVILSLKDMGMNLSEIHQYINGNDFDIQVFVEEEKRRVEAAITDLKLRLMRLSRLNEQVNEKGNIMSYILPLFSHMANISSMSEAQIDNFIKSADKKPAFNIKEWDTFIKDLNFCFEKSLPVSDKRTVKCVLYWKESVLKANQVDDDTVKLAEDFYQRNPTNGFGITEDTYKYLLGMIDEYDRIH
ncbi:MAG: MerR family transcriptional regulator [Lachnospiraceae bacterium]|nr:MerR family transcriptional regulator [Lachnospiraceae bacterium]